MTIKKTVRVKPTGSPPAPGEAADAAAPAKSGVAMADRFRLDLTEPSKKGPMVTKATTYAAVAGLVALAVVGFLAYTLYRHWEFLMPA